MPNKKKNSFKSFIHFTFVQTSSFFSHKLYFLPSSKI
jgi:hypothetical protein